MTTTPNKALQEPAYNSATWNVPLNANFANTDMAFGGAQGFDLSAASGVVSVSSPTYVGSYPANTPSYVPLIWNLSGTMTANVNLQLPSGVGGRWIVNNSTSGAFTVTISLASGGATITATQGIITDFYSGGGNVFAIGTNAVPAGTLIAYAGATAPTGYLLCYGQSVSTTTYANLFHVIGYSFGGSGAAFALPDLRGRVLAAPDNMGGTAAGRLTGLVSAGVTGAQAITLTAAQMPIHNHADFGHAHGISDPGHIHGGVISPGGPYGGSAPPYVPLSSGATAPAATGIGIQTGYANIDYAGGGGSHSNVQATIGINWAVKY